MFSMAAQELRPIQLAKLKVNDMDMSQLKVRPEALIRLRVQMALSEGKLTQKEHDGLQEPLKELKEELDALKAALRAVKYAARDF